MSAPGEAPLEIQGLTKRFSGRVILDQIDLRAGLGEVLVILGHNGAGKSTLLRIVLGSISADEGEVRADPNPGWVLGDEHSWYWRLSGRKNLEFFGRIRGLDPDAARREASEELERLGLSPAADQRVAMYSTGMKSRLGLARARLGAPRLLLLDEPTRGLDRDAHEQFMAWLCSSAAPATVLVTHTLEEAERVADRIVVLRHGRVVAEFPKGTSASELADALERYG